MKLNSKKIVIGLAGVALLGAGLWIFLQNRVERMASSYLTKNLPSHIRMDYEVLEADILEGSLGIKKIRADVFDKDSMDRRHTLALDELWLRNLDYWDYLVNDRMVWARVNLVNPHFVTYENKGSRAEVTEEKEGDTISMGWQVKELHIENGSFALVSEGSPAPVMSFQNVRASVYDIVPNQTNTEDRLPFGFGSFTFLAEDFQTGLGEYERLDIDRLQYMDKKLEARAFVIKTLLGKEELSEQIKTERDHTSLEIDRIVLQGPMIGFKDTLMQIRADSVLVERPVAKIYRDKLVADNRDYYPMYSQMLRELPFYLDMPLLRIKEGKLLYEERMKRGTGPGTLAFKDLNASIRNLSNSYNPPVKTEITASAMFMEDSPVELNWDFDINEPDELFTISGTISDFDASSINPFLESTMNYRVEGMVHKLYFTASGNKVRSIGDLEMNYRDFDLIILKEDGSGVNKLLTVIGDILVKENKDNSDPGFRYGKIEAERDPTKSFFNYLWLNIRSGIKSSVTGDGEKD